MTTIIGIEYGDKSVLVADSRVIDDSGRVYAHKVMRKIAKRGALLIAGAGEVAPCDIAQNIWNPPQFTAKDKKDGMRFQFLISVGGEIFDVDEDLSVMKNEDNVYAIGSGGPFALGALYAGAEPMQAMEIASKVSAYSAPPFYEEVQYK